MSTKDKKKKPATGKKATQGTKVELIAIPATPQREGFDVEQFNQAVQRAEDFQNPNRVLLYDYYRNATGDAHYISISGKRKDAIAGRKIQFTHEGKPHEKIAELIDSTWFKNMIVDVLESKFYGFSAMWLDLSGGEFRKYKLLPRKHIIPEKNQFLYKQWDRSGVDYTTPPYSNYVLTAGETDDLGLLLSIVPWVLLKRGDITDWSIFNELFAAPFRKGKYPLYNQEAKKQLAKACQEAGSMQYAIIPDVTDLEFIQNAAQGSTTAYREFAEFCDKQMSKAYLHNTMTTDAEGGMYKGDVHENSEDGVLESDDTFVISWLNEIFRPFLEIHGFNPGKGKFSIVAEDRHTMKDRIEIDTKLANLIEIPAEYFYDRYGIPIPKGGPKRVERAVFQPPAANAEHTDTKGDEPKGPGVIGRVKDFFA